MVSIKDKKSLKNLGAHFICQNPSTSPVLPYLEESLAHYRPRLTNLLLIEPKGFQVIVGFVSTYHAEDFDILTEIFEEIFHEDPTNKSVYWKLILTHNSELISDMFEYVHANKEASGSMIQTRKDMETMQLLAEKSGVVPRKTGGPTLKKLIDDFLNLP